MNSGIYEPGRFYQIEYEKLRNLINWYSNRKEIVLDMTPKGQTWYSSITVAYSSSITLYPNSYDKFPVFDYNLVEALPKGVKGSKIVLELGLFNVEELVIKSLSGYYCDPIRLEATRLPDIEVDKKFFIENFEIIK